MYTFTLMQYSFLRCIYKYICVTRDNTYYICKIWHTIGFFSMHIGICMHTYTEEENAVYLWVMRSFHYGPNVDQQCHEILINRVPEASEPAIYLLVTKFLTIIANQDCPPFSMPLSLSVCLSAYLLSSANFCAAARVLSTWMPLGYGSLGSHVTREAIINSLNLIHYVL